MASVASALRKFIVDVDRVFRSSRLSFRSRIAQWDAALTTLRKRVRSLGERFASLRTVRRVGENGEELVMLGGRIEAREFTSLLRTAKSAEAYERATGVLLSPAAKRAFQHMDDVAMTHFPDAVLVRRTRYLADARESLIERRVIQRGERVADAITLERLIRKDPEMLKRANALLSKTSRTRKLLYVGGAIVVTGLSLATLSSISAEYAANHTGCFMYTQDLANGTSKCRVLGCSCPMSLHGKAQGLSDFAEYRSPRPVACDEGDLWSKMHVRDNDCDRAADRPTPYCVHCRWDERDSDSVDFVDRSHIPENAYLSCERMDALDAMNEVLGSTLDGLSGIGASVTEVAKNSLATSAKVVPWVITGGALLVVIVVLVYFWRLIAPSPTAGSNDDHASSETGTMSLYRRYV